MIIFPVSGSNVPGRVVIAFSSDGGTEAAGDYTWTQHSESMRRVRVLVYETHSAGMFFTAGDNACQGAGVNGGYTGQCEQFLGPVGRIKATMGNHDNSDMGGVSAFNSFFGYSAPSHSWTYGNIQGFGCYSFNDAGTDFNVGTVQYNWLSRSLAASRADPAIKWRIAHFHTPVQCSTTNHAPNASAQSFPWAAWGVDAVFHGHNHTVERLETGSLAVYLCGGISNQKLGYQYTGVSTHSRWIYTNDTSPYNLARDYVFMILVAEENTLTLTFYNSSGSKLLDTGSTLIPNGQMVNNSLVLTKTDGGQPTGSGGITYTVVANKFVETGSWEATGSPEPPFTGSRGIILSRTASYTIWANGWALSPTASSTGSDWVSASFDDTAEGWTSSTVGPFRNLGLDIGAKPPPAGWSYNYTGLTAPASGSRAHYFRHKWNIPDSPSLYDFTASYITDDGCAVWINNQLAFTRLMPATWSWNQTTGTTTDPTASWTDTITSSYFVQGENIIAVEVHQTNGTSTDVAFGFEISGSLHGTSSSPEEPTGSTVNLYLINRTSSWTIYDKQGDPSAAGKPYEFVSWSYYNAGSASAANGWESGSHTGGPGSGSYHNPAESTIAAGWTYNGTASYTASTGPWTHLFLKTFDVPYTPRSDHSFIFRTHYDDGIYIYLNGEYVTGSGMGLRSKYYHQFAAANVEPNVEYAITITGSYFQSGSNLLVVELHQNNSASTDAAFGGELIYTGSSGTGTGSQPEASQSTLVLIDPTASWVYWDQFGDPSSGSQNYVSISYFAGYNGPASASSQGWVSGSGAFHNTTETGVPNARWTYNTTVDYTQNVGPFTHIFAKTFEVPSASGTFRVRHFNDDGLYCFVNGARCFSNNQTGSTWQFGESSSATLEPTTEYEQTISSSFFQVGTNLLVVQLHQVNLVTTDVAFGLMLEWTASSGTGSSPATESATTGSKFRFSQGGVMSCLAGPYSESLPASSYTNGTLVARMSSLGRFYANEFSEIPVTNALRNLYSGGDEWSTSSAVLWLNMVENNKHLNKVNTTHVSESASFKLTNLASYSDVGSADYFISDADKGVGSVISGSPYWTQECVFKLHNSCSLFRGYLVGRYSGSSTAPNRRATGFFTTPDNVLHVNYFNYTTDGGTTWFETTASVVTLSLDQWYHTALSYTTQSNGSSSFKTYLNGLLQFSASYLTSSYDIREGPNLYVGGASSLDAGRLDQASNAYIGVVAFYSRSLYDQEVRACALYYNKEYDFNI